MHGPARPALPSGPGAAWRSRRSRAALSDHAQRGTLAVIDGGAFEEPSTREAAALLSAWGADLPLLVIAEPKEEAFVKSFRNLPRLLIVEPSELEKLLAGID